MKSYAFLIMLITLFLLASCGTDDIDEPVLVNFISASPMQGVAIAVNATITVTFDNPPIQLV